MIQKSIKDALTLGGSDGLLAQQIREICVPILTQKMRSLDSTINQSVLPRVEAQIANLFQALIANGEIQNVQNKADQFNEQAVKQIVVKEFREAMSAQIVPAIEQALKKLLANLEKPVSQINLALCEKLSVEEDRNENMVNYY